MTVLLDEIKMAMQPMTEYILRFYELGISVWDMFPLGVQIFIKISYFLAVIGIVLSLIKAILHNRKNWKEKPKTHLMYSYFCGSGNYQRKLIYADAIKFLQDRRWSWISAAGLAFRLGNVQGDSMCLKFLGSILYLPLALCGLLEMTLRIIIGRVTYFFINIVMLVIFAILRIVSILLIPIFRIIDRLQRVGQHCPHCYATFNLPYFRCPHCGTIHKQLIPGDTGILVAKCSCGHFLSCSTLTKRSAYDAVCPKCNTDLAASNAQQFSIQVIGGNDCGKTSFIAAFQHIYLKIMLSKESIHVIGSPKKDFAQLEGMFSRGTPISSSPDKVGVFNLVHSANGIPSQNLIFYDVPDEIVLSEQYEKNPLNFGYTDGIIIMIDPLSIYSVREACKKTAERNVIDNYSGDSSEDIVLSFINKFSEISGRQARKMSSTPVAVLIAKSDISVVEKEIGLSAIKSQFDKNPEIYQNDISFARNEICRNYLMKLGLVNVVNNLDSVFSTIGYYSVSSIGHMENAGCPFEPIGVIEPIAWLAKNGHATISGYLSDVQSIVKVKGFYSK